MLKHPYLSHTALACVTLTWHCFNWICTNCELTITSSIIHLFHKHVTSSKQKIERSNSESKILRLPDIMKSVDFCSVLGFTLFHFAALYQHLLINPSIILTSAVSSRCVAEWFTFWQRHSNMSFTLECWRALKPWGTELINLKPVWLTEKMRAVGCNSKVWSQTIGKCLKIEEISSFHMCSFLLCNECKRSGRTADV